MVPIRQYLMIENHDAISFLFCTPLYWALHHWLCDYVADVLVPNRCQAINNHHADSNMTILSHESYCVLQILCYIQPIKQHDDVIKWKKISMLQALCEGNPLVTGGFPSQRPVVGSLDVFFDLCLNKRLSKQLRCHHSLWRHSNEQCSRVFGRLSICWLLWY